MEKAVKLHMEYELDTLACAWNLRFDEVKAPKEHLVRIHEYP